MISLLMLIGCLGFSEGTDTTSSLNYQEKSTLIASKLELANTYIENDNLNEARSALVEALELNPDISIAKEAIAFIDTQKERQTWQQTETTDEMDGTKLVMLAVDSQDRYTYYTGKRNRPRMIVRCNGGKLDAYINNGASTDDAYDGVTVRVKFDEDKPISFSADESTDRDSLFINKPNALVTQFSQRNTMLYEFTPFSSSPATLHFNISGWDEKAASLKELCNLK